jgi:hypothetical protein
MTQLVRIVSVNPFIVSPADLGELTFQRVGILDTELFKQVLLESLPPGLPAKTTEAILRMNLTPSVQIGLVINTVFIILSNPNA